MDKIEVAQQKLKELEKRCINEQYKSQQAAATPGWLSNVRYRLFGNSNYHHQQRTDNQMDSADDGYSQLGRNIETQIILADTFLSSAILTFLTQDISGFVCVNKIN